MPQFTFPLPERLLDVLKLINYARTDLRLTLVLPDGTVQGYFADEYTLHRISEGATPLAMAIAETLILTPPSSLPQAEEAVAFPADTEPETAETAGPLHILNGSMDEAKVIGVLDSTEQALVFLYGCFLGVFGGERLEKIHESVREPWEDAQ